MTESGIIPCNKRRNIEVESKPRVFLQGQEKSWEEIIPTRVSNPTLPNQGKGENTQFSSSYLDLKPQVMKIALTP